VGGEEEEDQLSLQLDSWQLAKFGNLEMRQFGNESQRDDNMVATQIGSPVRDDRKIMRLSNEHHGPQSHLIAIITERRINAIGYLVRIHPSG
jgi:hypothetical protein